MARAPAPKGRGNIHDQGGRSASRGGGAGRPPRLARAGLLNEPETPSAAAALRVDLLPVAKAGFDWAGMIGAAGPLGGLTIMGVIAPAVTIYAAKAGRYPPALTAAAVTLELALAYLGLRAVNGMALPSRTSQRGLPG